MKIEIFQDLTEEEKQSVYSMWNLFYPQETVFKAIDDFKHFLDKLAPQVHLIIRDQRKNLVGWLMLFNRDGARFFVLLVDENHRQQGIGSNLVREMMKMENEIHGWVVPHSQAKRMNGEPYISPLPFYKKLGFTELDEVITKNGLQTVKIRWQS